MAAASIPTEPPYPEALHRDLNKFKIHGVQPFGWESHSSAAAYLSEQAYGLAQALYFATGEGDNHQLSANLHRLTLEALSTVIALGCYHAQRSDGE